MEVAVSDKPQDPDVTDRGGATELHATLATVRDSGETWFWTSDGAATDRHALCLELERQGLIYRHVETPFGLIAWRALDG